MLHYKDWNDRMVYESGRYEVALVGAYGHRIQLMETSDADEAIALWAECVASAALGIPFANRLVERFALHPPVKIVKLP